MTHLSRFSPPQVSFSELENHEKTKDPRMDAESLPRPIVTSEMSTSIPIQQYDSDKLSFPPSSTSTFSCIDSGNATFRFARPSTNHFPAWPALQLSVGVPLGCVFQPFAQIGESEEPVPLVHSVDRSDPLRCKTCRGFVNPHFSWPDEGTKMKCNLCGSCEDVPSNYFSPVNGLGIRTDKFTKPELRCGSYDLLPPENSVESSSPPVTIFVIDYSYLSIHSGFFNTVLTTLRDSLTLLPLETEITLILFDEAIHFIKLELSRSGSPSLVSVSDIDDPFVPDPALCVSPHLLTDQLRGVLDQLIANDPLIDNPNRVATCCHAALSVAIDLAADKGGGSVVLFQAGPSKLGVGSIPEFLNIPNLPVHHVDDCQKQFFQEAEKRCREGHVCIDLFACSDSIVKIGLEGVSQLVHRTGGEIQYCNGSDLRYYLIETMTSLKFFNCILRLRVSRGLCIESVDVTQSIRKGIDFVSIPRMSNNSTITCSLSMNESVQQGAALYLQLACLFTRSDGVRLIRVHNVVLTATSHVNHIFKYSDVESLSLLIAKQGISNFIERPKSLVKDYFVQHLVTLLHAYRVHCARNSGSGQLILPDSLKTLPLLISGLLKQCGLRVDPREPPFSDEKVVNFWRLLNMNSRQASFSWVPRIFTVFPLSESSEEGRVTSQGNVILPKAVPGSRTKLSPSKIYLFDRLDTLIFYVGREVPPATVEAIFGKQVSIKQMDPKKSGIMDVEILNPQMHDWVNRIAWIAYALGNKRLKCILASSTVGETKISSLMIEDRIGNEAGYVDWLCQLHKLIQDKID
jgi:protein transport protein SEC24